MPSVEITSYTVHAGRLGNLGADRLIVLEHRHHGPGIESVLGRSEIYFADRFASSGSFGVVDHGATVTGHLPNDDFAVWVDLLRHEDPMYLHWSSELTGSTDPDGIIHLATGPEPPGEGPIDLSP